MRPHYEQKKIYLFTSLISCSNSFIYLLPLWFEKIGSHSSNAGIVFSIGGVGCLLIVGFSSKLAAQIGTKTIAILGAGFCSLGFFLWGIAHFINPIIYIGSFMINMGWGLVYATLPMLLVSEIPSSHHGKFLAHLTAFIVIGGGLGPVLGEIILSKNFDFPQIFYFPAVSSILALLLLSRYVHNETEITSAEPAVDIVSRKTKLNLTTYLVMLMVFAGACVPGALVSFQTIYAKAHHLNYTFFYISYILTTVISRFVCKRLLSSQPAIKPVPYLLLLMALGMLIFLLNHHSNISYILGTLLISIGYGLSYPLLITFVVSLNSSQAHHKLLAYMTLAYFFGIYLFSLCSGYLITYSGLNNWVILLLSLSIGETIIGSILFFKTIVKSNQ